MSTPHIDAASGAIAKVVLMPGDPLRAKFIADTYLSDVTQFNHVRNMFGYTGYYQGTQVSVMGSGMGMPSIGIYSYELYSVYDVDVIIRVGSAGGYHESVDVLDVVLVDKAYSESSFARVQNNDTNIFQYPSNEIQELLKKSAEHLQYPYVEGCIHSSDVFYQERKDPYYEELYREYGCIGVEMESFALFHNAKVLGKQAACILTISDSFTSKKQTTAKERETSFTKMMEIALHAATHIQK